MAEKLDLLLEAERRGILPAPQKALLDEARRRGLVPGFPGMPPLGTEIVGRTPEGRPIIKNPDGSFSTERTITVTHPSINGGKPTNIPSIFGGKELTERQAIEIIARNRGIDPETGRRLQGFGSIAEAEAAARSRSEGIHTPTQGGLPDMPANGPLRSPLDDPLLAAGFREGAGRAVAGAQPPAGQADPDGALAFTRAFARRLGDNILATPELLADVILPRLMPRPGGSGPLDLISQGISGVTGGAVDPAAAAERVRERVRQGGHVIDLPSTTDIAAGIETAVQAIPAAASDFAAAAERVRGPLVTFPGELSRGDDLGLARPAPRGPAPSLGERFRQAQEEQMVTDIQMGEGAPIATGAGEVAGDIATIAGGRSVLRGGVPLQRATTAVAERAQTIWGRAIQNTGRALARTGARAGEAGAEGALLAQLQGADPAVVGGIAAGSQTAAQPLIGLVKRFANNRLGQTVLTASVISLGIQGLTPGGLNRFLPTFEGLSQEALVAILLGGAGVLVGGRVPKEFTTNQAVVELANVIPRGALLSVLNSYAKDSARVGPVLAKFAEDPDFFGPKAKRLLTRALTVEDIDLSGTLDRLMEEREFRRGFQALTAASASQ